MFFFENLDDLEEFYKVNFDITGFSYDYLPSPDVFCQRPGAGEWERSNVKSEREGIDLLEWYRNDDRHYTVLESLEDFEHYQMDDISPDEEYYEDMRKWVGEQIEEFKKDFKEGSFLVCADGDGSCWVEPERFVIGYNDINGDGYSFKIGLSDEDIEELNEFYAESKNTIISDLFKTEFKNKMNTKASDVEKDSFLVAKDIVDKWKTKKPYYISRLNSFLSKSGCNTKEGWEKFLKSICESDQKRTHKKDERHLHER